jgi:serine/threonine protein kinase
VHGYTLHETLGTGTFGRVRRATKDGREHAIKIVSREQLAATGMAPQLKREVAIQKSLNHPHIVELRQVLRSPNKLYLVLELAAKGELYWLIQRNGPLPLNLARRALFQLTDALLFGHTCGVIHRDVKPENILIGADGSIKLTDFGLSTSGSAEHAHAYGGIDCLPDPRLLRTACGSPHYCAPEVRTPGARGSYDGFKADAWSVGVVLFLMLNGYLPFHNDDPLVLQSLVQSHPVDYPDSMPSQPRQICENLLQRDPAKRWSLDMVINHPFCKADPSLHRAVAIPPSLTSTISFSPSPDPALQPTPDTSNRGHNVPPSPYIPCPSIPSPLPPSPRQETLDVPADGWYTFGSRPRRMSKRRASRMVPRETVPEFPGDDASFSEADIQTEEVPVEDARPRHKSVLSAFALSKATKFIYERQDRPTASISGVDHALPGKSDLRRRSRLGKEPKIPRRKLSNVLTRRWSASPSVASSETSMGSATVHVPDPAFRPVQAPASSPLGNPVPAHFSAPAHYPAPVPTFSPIASAPPSRAPAATAADAHSTTPVPAHSSSPVPAPNRASFIPPIFDHSRIRRHTDAESHMSAEPRAPGRRFGRFFFSKKLQSMASLAVRD